MSYQFHIGQKVVCITDSNEKWHWAKSCEKHLPGEEIGPHNKQILIIEDLDSCGSELFLSFPEWPDEEFNSTQFRPLISTNIDIFRAMLSPKPKQKVKV